MHTIAKSGLFDADWYRNANTDVARIGADPLLHYVYQGSLEGRNPHPLFDSAWYLDQNQDVSRKGVEPFSHYLRRGDLEGRRPHYSEIGWKHGRKPNALFDPNWYINQYSDVRETNMEPLSHFVQWGSQAGRWPTSLFDPEHYASKYPEIAEAGWEPFAHYLWHGREEGREPIATWAQYRRQQRASALGLLQAFRRPRLVVVGIVTFNNPGAELNRCIRSILSAAKSAALIDSVQIWRIDNGESLQNDFPEVVHVFPGKGNVGFGAAHNALMAEAFEEEADYYLALNPDGALESESLSALLRTSQAPGGPHLVEAIQFPEEHPKTYDELSFAAPWASGACLLIPAKIYAEIGGFDERFFMYCEDVDYSWRTRSAGFGIKTCPRALFFHDVTNRPFHLETHALFLRSGLALAQKWRSPSFERIMRNHMEHWKISPPEAADAAGPVAAGNETVTDFDHLFHFAPARW